MPDDPIQHVLNQALEHHRAGRMREAEMLYRQVLAARPQHPTATHLLGLLSHQTGRHTEAIALIRRSIQLVPGDADAYLNLGLALAATGQIEEAIAAYQQALALRPRHVEALGSLALALQHKGELDEAIARYRDALSLRPQAAEIYNNLGTALKERGQFEQAMGAYRQALALRPNDAGIYNNLGLALRDAGELDQAIDAYQQALKLKPDYADAHYCLAWALLLKGEYRQGWQQYEWRWRKREWLALGRNFSQPGWDGAELSGRRIVLHAEQGLGDTIQFVRYVPLVAQRGGRSILLCQRPLMRLLSRMNGLEQLVAPDEPLPPFDVHCPLLSLPNVLGTTLETIPHDMPYLNAEQSKVAHWRERMDSVRPGLRVALVWAGSAANANDRRRSMVLDQLAPLARAEHVRFFSLQKGSPADQAAPPGLELIRLGPELEDFTDTAAALLNLDLLITVDTSMAHLAGALGRPAWVLLPFAPDFRWMLHRSDSPWYPTLRLFRQSQPGDWASVVERVSSELSSVNASDVRAALPPPPGIPGAGWREG